jgi:endosialidase-like protein
MNEEKGGLMSVRNRALFAVVLFACSFGTAVAQEAIPNWAAPSLWSHPGRALAAEKQSGIGTDAVEAVEAVPTAPLHFVGITPCRVADTRGNGFTGQYGPPALTPVGRNMVIAGQCGIPVDAQAVSFNFSAVNVAAAGFFVAYPAGGAFPAVATMTYNQNTPNLSNAAVVPLGTGGAITVVAAVTNIDLVVDINGYYQPGVVTAVNGLSGNVTLAAGSNVTITPGGQALTIASTGGLPSGTADQTLRHNGTSWVATGLVTLGGSDVTVNGVLHLPDPQTRVDAGANRLLYTDLSNMFLGPGAGKLTSGSQNVAFGANALDSNVGGSFNVAIGYNALTAVTSGVNNIGIGNNVGSAVSTGSNNIYIGNDGFNNESGQIRIGTAAAITSGTVIVGISGFQSVGGVPVIVNGGGRLGTTTSSIRFKEDVRDLGAASDDLMKLRPVTFRYKESDLQEYGLIAEEVAKVYPELVVNDDQGRPLMIRSQLLDPLLLNEIQKQRCEIEELKARLEKLEGKSAP